MATTNGNKKTTTTRKKTTGTKGTNSKTATKKVPAKKPVNKQAVAIIMFFTGILLALFTFIKGDALWTTIHNGLLSFFGTSAYLVPLIVIYASVMIALEKNKHSIMSKVFEGIILIILFSGITQIIFSDNVFTDDIWENIQILLSDGLALRGGGLASAIIGVPLILLFGKVGAIIIAVILILIFFILLANLSLIQIFKFFAKPFKRREYEEFEEEEVVYPERKTVPEQKADDPFVTKRKPVKKVKEKKGGLFTKVIEEEIVDENALTIEQAIQKEAEKFSEESKKVKVKMDTAPIEEEKDILPMHPVISPKVTEDKLIEAAKTTEDPELANIITKAVEIKALKDKEKNEIAEKSSSIIVDDNGQTCLYEKDNTINMYKSPPISILKAGTGSNISENTQIELKNNSETLVDTLKSFGVQTRIVDICRGPAVTRYELQPAAGVKVSKITNLTDDIKMSLAAKSIRIEAPIPGKAAVGVEIPNNEVDVITMREMLESKEFTDAKSSIAFALGKDITGNTVVADIAKMPHVLIAGATGSGKSVCINSILISLLYRSSPEDVRLLMIDPKMVELEVYNGIPHLLIPVVTDPRKAAGALSWAVTEMTKRYKLFADNNVRNLTGYNELAEKTEGLEPLPQIVIIIDELADLMMVAAKDVEEAICRLAQLARAAGMHLVIATQRPSVDVITGIIKANIPSRIAFAVSSQIDSRTVLDGAGAEKLLGRGDMLYSAYGAPVPTRVQGCFVSDKEVENVVAFIKNEIKADYDDGIMEEIEKNAPVPKGEKGESGGGSIDSSDEMIEKAIEVVIETGQASTSFLQRRLKLGYARAARIMDELYAMGIVGEQDGAKPRKILMTKEMWYESRLQNNNDA